MRTYTAVADSTYRKFLKPLVGLVKVVEEEVDGIQFAKSLKVVRVVREICQIG
jgi:hypothetical protein